MNNYYYLKSSHLLDRNKAQLKSIYSNHDIIRLESGDKMSKNILKIMLGTIIAEVVLACIFILIGKFSNIGAKAMASIAIIFFYSIPCLFYSKIYEYENYKNISIAGLCISGITALVTIIGIWGLLPDSTILNKMLYTCNTLIIALVFISWLLHIIPINTFVSRFRTSSIILVSVSTVWSLIIYWTNLNISGFLGRLNAMLAVLTAGSLISMFVLKRIYKKEINASEKMIEQESVVRPQNEVQPIPTTPTNNEIPNNK